MFVYFFFGKFIINVKVLILEKYLINIFIYIYIYIYLFIYLFIYLLYMYIYYIKLKIGTSRQLSVGPVSMV